VIPAFTARCIPVDHPVTTILITLIYRLLTMRRWFVIKNVSFVQQPQVEKAKAPDLGLYAIAFPAVVSSFQSGIGRKRLTQ